MPFPSALKIGRTRDGYCIRVEGHARSQANPAVLELFVVQILDSAAGRVTVDLSRCEEIDRKFLACLVDLHRHYGSGRSPRFAVAASSDARPGLCSSSSCAGNLLALDCGCPETIGEELVLPPWEAGNGDLDLHLREWHRWVAELGRTSCQCFAEPSPREALCD